jgi:hypothetical protein
MPGGRVGPVRVRAVSLAAVAALLLSGCQLGDTSSVTGSSTKEVAVPNVIGTRLVDADKKLLGAGFRKVVPLDDSSKGRVVVDPENWVVDSQDPKAGSHAVTGSIITLKVRRPTDGASTSTKFGVVPRVICMNLQDAQDAMEHAGFFNLGSADGSGKGRMQILDRDWVVTKQTPAAGSKPGVKARIVLTAVKYGESTGSSHCKD